MMEPSWVTKATMRPAASMRLRRREVNGRYASWQKVAQATMKAAAATSTSGSKPNTLL